MTTTNDMPASISTLVERRFYVVARWFGLILASITFLAALFAGAVSIQKLTSTPDNQLRPPNISYDDFRSALEAAQLEKKKTETDTTLQRKEQEVANAQESLNLERKLKPHLDAIIANLIKYADILQLAKPSEQGVGNFVREYMQKINYMADDTIAWKYVDNLEKATANLANDAERLSKLNPDDSRKVRWDGFLKVYTAKFIDLLEVERGRISGEQTRVAIEKAEALVIIYGAIGAFFTFIIATILLVLLRIERNTRPTPHS